MADTVLSNLYSTGEVDILNNIARIRAYRPAMVSTVTLLQVVYDIVSTFIISGKTVVPTAEIPGLLSKLSNKNSTSRLSGLENELKVRHVIYCLRKLVKTDLGIVM